MRKSVVESVMNTVSALHEIGLVDADTLEKMKRICREESGGNRPENRSPEERPEDEI